MAKQSDLAGETLAGTPAVHTAGEDMPRLDPSTWAASWTRIRKGAFVAGVQVCGDLVLLSTGVVLAYLMLFSWPPSMGIVHKSLWNLPTLILQVIRSAEFRPLFPLAFILPILRLAAYQWIGVYKTNLSDTRPFAPSGAIVKGTVLGSALAALLATGYRSMYPETAPAATLLFLAYEGLIAFFFVLLYHSATLIAVLCLHALGLWRTRVVVIHDGTPPEGLLDTLMSPANEYTLMGEILLPREEKYTSDTNPLKELKALINHHDLDEVILAVDPGNLQAEQRLDVAQTCWRMGVQIKMCSPFQPFFRTSTLPEMVGDIPLLHVENLGLYASFPQMLKRLMDIAVSFCGLVAISPLLLIVAILIRLDSPGPIFFIQERVGLNGRTFRMIKFRSMRADSDPAIHKKFLEAMIQSGDQHEVDADGKPVYKMINDPRITRLGHFIRKTSIDELPQLINVLLGHMSLVGPRPPIQYEVDAYKDWHMKRLYIRPGVTGLWQVSGRNRLSFDQMVQLDIAYIEQWSLWLDLKILLRTIPVVLHIEQAF